MNRKQRNSIVKDIKETTKPLMENDDFEEAEKVAKKKRNYRKVAVKVCASCGFFYSMAEPDEGFDTHGECYLLVKEYPGESVDPTGTCDCWKRIVKREEEI